MLGLQPKLLITLEFSIWKAEELNTYISVICDLPAPLGHDSMIYCHNDGVTTPSQDSGLC